MRVMPNTTSTGTTMKPMAMRYRLSANRPCRQSPVMAQMDRGMMETSSAIAPTVLRKVITWR